MMSGLIFATTSVMAMLRLKMKVSSAVQETVMGAILYMLTSKTARLPHLKFVSFNGGDE